METITSVNNNLVKETCKLKLKKYRDETGLFIMEGEHLVIEACNANLLKYVFVRKGLENKFNYPNTYIVSDEVMQKISETVSILDILAVCYIPKTTKEFGNKVVILDGVQDPGNLGTIIRTALSFGYNDLIVSKDTVDLYNEKVIRSTQGALLNINYLKADLKAYIGQLKQNGYLVYGTSLRNAKPLKEFKKEDKIALVFGNEGNGVKEEILDICDNNIIIEMQAFESLNVAVASGIVMYHFM